MKVIRERMKVTIIGWANEIFMALVKPLRARQMGYLFQNSKKEPNLRTQSGGT